MRSSRPFPNNPHLKLRHGYACTEHEPFLQRGDAGNGLSSLGVIQACRKSMMVKQRSAGICFSLIFLSGVGEGKLVSAAAPGITGPGSAISCSSCLCPNLPGCSQILPVHVDPAGCSCVLPVTLLAGKCSVFIAFWCVCFSGLQCCRADSVAVD